MTVIHAESDFHFLQASSGLANKPMRQKQTLPLRTFRSWLAKTVLLVTGSAAFWSGSQSEGFAQPRPAAGSTATQNANWVIVKRDAIRPVPPENFQNHIALTPTKIVKIRASVSGTIQNVRVKPGSKVSAQEELIRIESTQLNKELERARAALKVATLRRDLAKTEVGANKQPQLALDLAAAELELAQSNLELAQYHLEQALIRAPFAGSVTAVNVTEKASVEAGDVILEIRDSNELSALVPVDREAVKEGDTISLKLNNATAEGKIQAILPLEEKWQNLTQLVSSAATALVIVNNANNSYQDGQTVYSEIVPRQPIVEVANSALKSSQSGKRHVQVLRDQMIRDIEVQLLGAIGEDRSYVSGPFQEKDELILETSLPLADSTVLRPNHSSDAPGTGTSATGRKPATPPATNTDSSNNRSTNPAF